MLRHCRKFIIFIFFSTTISAHPHVFFDSIIKLKIENKTLLGIELVFYLDEMNTLLNREIFSPESDGEIKKKNILFLKDIFKHIQVVFDGKKISKDNIIFELAKLEDDILRIDLFLDIDKEIKADSKMILSIHDKDYYYTYYYNNKTFEIDRYSGNQKVNFRLYTNKKESFYFNLIHPEEYEVTFK